MHFRLILIVFSFITSFFINFSPVLAVGSQHTPLSSTTWFVVKPHQTLYGLAHHHCHVTVRTMVACNHLKSQTIRTGQKLKCACSTPLPRISHQTPTTLRKTPRQTHTHHHHAATRSAKHIMRHSYHTVHARAPYAVERHFHPIHHWRWPIHGYVVKRGSLITWAGYQGIEILGHWGQSVCATADGVVVYAGSGLRGYGRMIIIRHNRDYLSTYAYNHRIFVKEGQWVRAGQCIAKVGATPGGRVLLHFQIRYHGRSVNPLYYLGHMH